MRLVVVAAATGLTMCAARAQGTDDQRTACYSDALRLCSMYVPDEKRIETCLEANRPSLTPACQAQFDPPAPAPKARARR